MKHIAFIHTINPLNLIIFTIKTKTIDHFVCVNWNGSSKLLSFLKKRASVDQINFSNIPHSYFKKEKYQYELVEKLFKLPDFFDEVYSILGTLNLQTEKLITSLKKKIISGLSDDAKIITLEDELYKENNKYVLVNEYKMLKSLVDEDKKLRKNFSPQYVLRNYVFMFYKLASCLKLLFKKVETPLYNFRGIKFIFEQLYSHRYGGNPEFAACYRYFKHRDDILYIATSKDSEIYKTLKAEGKHVIARNETFVCKDKKWEQLKLLIVFFLRTIFSSKLKSIIVKIAMLDIYYYQLYYEGIFRKIKPLYYLKIRSDFDSSHPVATAVADTYNIKHIGYMCGSYGYITSAVAHIDFHYYGLLGKWFRCDRFKNYWPDNTEINYHILGPFTGETDECCVTARSNHLLTVSLFPTSTSDDIWINDDFYRFFINETSRALSESSLKNFQAFFKEKYFSKWRLKVVEDTCEKYKLVYQIFYHTNVPNYPMRSTESVIKASDIVIVMGSTTTAFEALGKKRKLIVVEQEWASHPFEKYLPIIVVKNREELRLTLSWLIDISQEKYEEQIQQVIENCCKVSDGNLFRDFIESIEKATMLENQKKGKRYN
jgi:hypothetical protein